MRTSRRRIARVGLASTSALAVMLLGAGLVPVLAATQPFQLCLFTPDPATSGSIDLGVESAPSVVQMKLTIHASDGSVQQVAYDGTDHACTGTALVVIGLLVLALARRRGTSART